MPHDLDQSARASALSRRPRPEEEPIPEVPAGDAGTAPPPEAALGDMAIMLGALAEQLPPDKADLVGQAAELLRQAAGAGAPQEALAEPEMSEAGEEAPPVF